MTKILFLATEDWFVRSHFRPLLQRARDDGFEVVVAARESGALADMQGVRLIDTPFARGSLAPWTFNQQVAHLRALLERERPDIVHAIALRPILLLAASGFRTARVLALTGQGALGVSAAPWAPLARAWALRSIRDALRAPSTLLLTENEADRRWIGADAQRTMLMPGAGVDADAFVPAPEPAPPPIVVGLTGRLIRSKGVDLAVAAVTQARARGADMVLRVAGAADAHNPEHVAPADIARWSATPGIEMLGRVADINAFWAGAHIACLPSRGGEGLPRSLLEAAACGRPLVTSDAPGCGDFVDHGVTGLVTPRGDVAALTGALLSLANDARLRARMGAAARAKVLAGYTETHAADVAAQAWRKLLGA